MRSLRLHSTAASPLPCKHLIDCPRVVDRLRRVFALSFVALGVKLATTARTETVASTVR